mgnify:CR=1 FL=1
MFVDLIKASDIIVENFTPRVMSGWGLLDALKKMRFRPAEVGGRAVRQLVQQPFVFQLGR